MVFNYLGFEGLKNNVKLWNGRNLKIINFGLLEKKHFSLVSFLKNLDILKKKY